MKEDVFTVPKPKKKNLAKAVFFVQHPNPKSPWQVVN
jgi:hypothetical protein